MQITIDVKTTREEILNALMESEDNQSIIGIASAELGLGMFMTSVKEIMNEEDEAVIILNSYDITGYFLEKKQDIAELDHGSSAFQSSIYKSILKRAGGKRREVGLGGDKTRLYFLILKSDDSRPEACICH